MLLVNNVQSPEEMPGCCGSQPYFSIPSEEKLSKDRWKYLWHTGFRQTWTEKNAVVFSLLLFAPVNFCSIRTVLSSESGICCSNHPLMLRHVYELFSESSDITSLGNFVRSFSMQPDLNKFTTLLATKASLRSCGDWGEVVNFHLLQREMEER